MSTRILAFLSFFLLTAFPTVVRANEPSVLTLEQSIDLALQSNPMVRRLALSADEASWRKLEALSAHLPHLSLDATQFLTAKYSRLGVVFGGAAINFPSAYPQTDLQATASLLVFDGLGSIERYQASRLSSDAAELEYERAKFQLEEGVRIKFYEALAANDLVQVADEDIKTLEHHLSLAQVSQRAGVSTRVEVLRIESQLEEANAEKLLDDDNAVLARKALARIMGTEDSSLPLAGHLPVPEAAHVPPHLKWDPSERKDLLAQEKRESAQDHLNSAARDFWFPKVTLFGTEEWYKFGHFDPAILPNATFQNAYSVGFKLTWNLFDGGYSIAKKAEASDEAQEAIESGRQLDLEAPEDFDMWKRRYLYNTALYQARQRSVQESEESVRLATLGVRAGTQTHSEALDAELDLFRARAGVVRAQIDAARALSNLELAVGHSF